MKYGYGTAEEFEVVERDARSLRSDPTNAQALAECPRLGRATCGAMIDTYACTRPKGHPGGHIACDGTNVCLRWTAGRMRREYTELPGLVSMRTILLIVALGLAGIAIVWKVVQ